MQCFGLQQVLGGRGTLPGPAVLAALPAVAAGEASASSPPPRLCLAEATGAEPMALEAGFALEAATGAVEQSFEIGKP